MDTITDEIINEKNIFIIIKLISNKLNLKHINDSFTLNIMKFIKSLNIKNIYIDLMIKNKKILSIIDEINNDIVNKYILIKFNTNNIDIHSVLNNFIKNEQLLIQQNKNNIKGIDITYTKDDIRSAHVFLDSRYRNIAITDNTLISFIIINDTQVRQQFNGTVTAIGNIKNIIQLEIPTFTIPYVTSADNYYKKITLLIKELSSDCYESYEMSYHFSFSTEKIDNLIKLTPDKKKYSFKKPITNLDNFTLKFGSPLHPIKFDIDRLIPSNINYNTNPGEFTFNQNHNLKTDDIIYITNFTSLNPAKDYTILEEINSKEGHLITRITNTIISINVSLSDIQFPDLNLQPMIYFGSKRILIPLTIKYLINH